MWPPWGDSRNVRKKKTILVVEVEVDHAYGTQLNREMKRMKKQSKVEEIVGTTRLIKIFQGTKDSCESFISPTKVCLTVRHSRCWCCMLSLETSNGWLGQ